MTGRFSWPCPFHFLELPAAQLDPADFAGGGQGEFVNEFNFLQLFISGQAAADGLLDLPRSERVRERIRD